MTHPADNSALLQAADDIRAYERAQGAQSRQAEVNGIRLALDAAKDMAVALTADNRALVAAIADLRAQLAALTGPSRRDLFAIRVLPQQRKTPYGDYDKVIAALGDLGVKRVSGLLTPSMSKDVIGFYQRLRDEHGIKVWFAIGEPRVVLADAQWAKITGLLTSDLAGCAELVSGWNEANWIRGTGHAPAGWEIATAAHQRKLYTLLGKPGLGLEVATPPLWSGQLPVRDADERTLAPLIQGAYDTVNGHLYPRGTVGTDLRDQAIALYEELYGKGVKIACTEGGYSTRGTDGVVVTEAQQAALAPLWAESWTSLGHRAGYFELLDGPADNREDSLGIIRADWTPKPAYTALKEWLA